MRSRTNRSQHWSSSFGRSTHRLAFRYGITVTTNDTGHGMARCLRHKSLKLKRLNKLPWDSEISLFRQNDRKRTLDDDLLNGSTLNRTLSGQEGPLKHWDPQRSWWDAWSRGHRIFNDDFLSTHVEISCSNWNGGGWGWGWGEPGLRIWWGNFEGPCRWTLFVGTWVGTAYLPAKNHGPSTPHILAQLSSAASSPVATSSVTLVILSLWALVNFDFNLHKYLIFNSLN
jgi:hypothetical protein